MHMMFLFQFQDLSQKLEIDFNEAPLVMDVVHSEWESWLPVMMHVVHIFMKSNLRPTSLTAKHKPSALDRNQPEHISNDT